MCNTKSKFRREIESMLSATGKPWRIERRKKHNAVVLDGKTIAVVSTGPAHRRDTINIAALIRRAVRG